MLWSYGRSVSCTKLSNLWFSCIDLSSISQILDDDGPDDGSPNDPSSGPSARRLLARPEYDNYIHCAHA